MIGGSALPRCIIYSLARLPGDGEDLLLQWLPEAWGDQWPMARLLVLTHHALFFMVLPTTVHHSLSLESHL